MEYSLTVQLRLHYDYLLCLNPYSNGILSDKLKESVLDFSCFFSLCFNPFSVRELVPSEKFFAKRSKFNTHSK